MSMKVRNVNEAFSNLRTMLRARLTVSEEAMCWRNIAPRGMRTLEWKGVFVTEYTHPCERVLFDPVRDANPFFHFFEALWLLAGRSDVAFLAQFNSNIVNFSDDGVLFYGAYGKRLRNHFNVLGTQERATTRYSHRLDQLKTAIELLKDDHDTRQVVLSIWDPEIDLGAKTKDLPCNDLLMLKIRDGKLNLTVCCRSNDAVWGAYGANVVQFSTLQEFIARAVGVEVGVYSQVSDSFHVYIDRPDFEKNFGTEYVGSPRRWRYDNTVRPFALINDGTPWREWLSQCELFCEEGAVVYENADPYFTMVATPLYEAWKLHKAGNTGHAIMSLGDMVFCDWKVACCEWLNRRLMK